MVKIERKCSVDGCDNKHRSNGYCQLHHSRYYRHGNPNVSNREMHGMKDNPVYSIWDCMKQRCYNKNVNHYKNYGGRGITVCNEWRNSFVSFYKYIGDRPSINHSLDRIDVNGNYEPGNVRWATVHEQCANRRNSNNVVGVSVDTMNDRYHATLMVARTNVLNKYFKNYDEAVSARKAAELEYGI